MDGREADDERSRPVARVVCRHHGRIIARTFREPLGLFLVQKRPHPMGFLPKFFVDKNDKLIGRESDGRGDIG
jgi:hypothetical protein